MRVGIFVFTGLWTDPRKDCCGMKPAVQKFAADYLAEEEVEFFYHAYDEADPNTLCQRVLAEMAGGNFDRIACLGHSFGGAFLEFFLHWLSRWHPQQLLRVVSRLADGTVIATRQLIVLCVFFDPAPHHLLFGQIGWDWKSAQMPSGKRWHFPDDEAAVCLCFYQHRDVIECVGVGVAGVPFTEHTGVVTNFEVSGWAYPELGHSSLIVDPKVQAKTRDFMLQALQAAA